MSYINLFSTIAGLIGATLIIIFYYRRLFSRLEQRANRIIEEMKEIIDAKYFEISGKIISRFTYQLYRSYGKKGLSELSSKALEKLGSISDFESYLRSFKIYIKEVPEPVRKLIEISDEDKEKLEDTSYIGFRLKDLPNNISKVIRKLDYSVFSGICSAFFLIIFPYVPAMNLDLTYSILFQIIVGVLMSLSFYQYVRNGLLQFSSLHDLEELVNNIERSNTFDQLYELLE